MKHYLGIGLAVLLVGASSGAMGAPPPRAVDPDWPCIQPLVPTLSAGMLWSGPPIETAGDWHAEPRVAALVARIGPRKVPAAEGEAAIAEFLKSLGADRDRLSALAFAGLLDESNRQRGEVIERLKELAQRQRKIADIVADLTTQMDALPVSSLGGNPAPGGADPVAAEPSGEEAAHARDLNERWTYVSRTHTEMQRTMRYICEVPVQIDSRLGTYARALMAQ